MGILEGGNCSMNNGDYETAIEHYKKCLNSTHENSLKTIACFGLGNAYTLSDKRKEAINCFNDCLNLSSKLEIKYFQHQIYLGLGSIHSTTKRLEEGITKDEMVCLCHVALGGLNKLLENYEQSLDDYRKGFSLIQSQQQQHHRPRRPRKVGGINVSKDFFNLNMKNLSIVTSAGIVSGVLAVLWELAELFDKLEQWGDATFIYEMYLEIVTEDENIAKQENAMEYLIQIYKEEGRDFLKDSMTTRLQEFRERKKNQELQLQEWEYNDPSIKHKKKFLEMIDCRRNPNVKVELLNDVRVIFSDKFCIGNGSDGTRVYLGLSKDGYGKAVKRILQYNFIDFAEKEMKIFSEIKEKNSNYLVNYSYFKKDTETEWVYLILDLCEESLESFVHSSTLEDLQNSLPKILRHILLGLADLHFKSSPILHRNLKPSNILCNAKGEFLIADFGLSRIMKNGLTTHASIGDRGTPYWIAPESYCKDDEPFDESSYKRESDVMNAGLVAYYVATKGKHPFGSEECRLANLLDGNPVGLKEIKDVQLKHILSWMLQLNPNLRPSANEALKHPYLLSDKEKFDMLCDLSNQPVIKIYRLLHPANSDVHMQLNRQRSWTDCIDSEAFNLFNKQQYDSTWLGCVEFLLNFHQHRHDKPPTQLPQSNGNYEEYFLQVFPELPLLVHNIMRLMEGKSIPDLEDHLTNMQLQEWKHIDESTKNKQMLLKLIKCGHHSDYKVENVNNVRVIFSDEFCIGKGNDGTRVYVGLREDGCEKAVKRIRRDSCIKIAENEKKILNEGNAKNSQYVVNYSYYEENLGKEYVYLILDLCEESLEEYVKSNSNSLNYLQKLLPDILKQILNGLADLHRGPRPILHRDLKPSNVLRNAQGKFLIADFGISRILKNGFMTHVSKPNKGTLYWIAPESYSENDDSIDKVDKLTVYKKESDVMNAGMVAYFVATKGKHPFGTKAFRLQNMLGGKPVGLEEIKDVQLKDLLSWMLQRQPGDRPSAEEALRHPYLLSLEKKFSMLCDMGNQPEMKHSQGHSSPNSDVVAQLSAPMKWMTRIDDEVLKDFKTFKKNGKKKTLTYEPTLARCLRFIRNVNEHWNDKPRTHLLLYIKEGNYVDYFLQRFPELPLLVHKIIRSTDWKTRPDLKKHFTNTKLVEQLEEINGKKSEDINDDMDLDVEIERVNGRKNKENPSHDVFLKDGLDMEENEDVAQSQKLDSFSKSLIQSGRWEVGDMYRFRLSLVLGSDKGTFYICERTLGSENATVVLNLLKAGRGAEVVNEIEKYSIEGRTLRQQAIVFFLAVCARKGDLATKRQAYKALPKICRISTHLFMFINFCKMLSKSGKCWGRAHRNAIKRWYKEKDPCKLALDITKYQRREGWSHRDVARLMHLKPEGTDVSDELFVIMKYVVCGWQRLFEYFFPEDNTAPHRPIGEKGSAMLVFFKAVEEVKTAQEEARVVELINQHNLVREHIPAHWLNSKEVWRALVQKMPMTAMLRNLGKMTIVELLDEQMALSCICEKLLNQDLLKRARIHPFNVLVALKTYVDGHGDKGRLKWNPNEAIVNALKEAFYLSFKSIQPTNKRYMLALDVSTSMSYSGCAGTPCLAPCVAAAVMSMVTARTESKHLFVAFSYKIVPLMISSDMTLDEVLELMELIPIGGTDCAQPMLYAIKNNLEVDVFIVYTDSETKAGYIHPSEALKRYRQHSGIQAKLIVVAMTSNGFTIADPEDIGMLDIVGFGSAAPQVMREFISR